MQVVGESSLGRLKQKLIETKRENSGLVFDLTRPPSPLVSDVGVLFITFCPWISASAWVIPHPPLSISPSPPSSIS